MLKIHTEYEKSNRQALSLHRKIAYVNPKRTLKSRRILWKFTIGRIWLDDVAFNRLKHMFAFKIVGFKIIGCSKGNFNQNIFVDKNHATSTIVFYYYSDKSKWNTSRHIFTTYNNLKTDIQIIWGFHHRHTPTKISKFSKNICLSFNSLIGIQETHFE